MSETAIIYTVLLGCFVLLVVIIRLIPGYRFRHHGHMYYRLNVKRREINKISAAGFDEETMELSRSRYEQVFLTAILAFVRNGREMPLHSFFVAMDASCYDALKTALPSLVKADISIFIYLPIPVSKSAADKEVQQLNEFIFSEEFQQVFSHPLNKAALYN